MSTEAKNSPATGAVPKKSKMMLIVILLLVVVAGAGGFFGWKYFKSAKADTTEHAASSGHGDEESGDEEKPKKGKKKKKEIEKEHGDGATVNFEPFLVNLADKESSRYVKTSIRLLVANKESAETIAKGETLMPRLRDTILSLLSAKTAEEITSNDGKEKLKKEILEKVNEYLPGEGAEEVFFTDFVVQF